MRVVHDLAQVHPASHTYVTIGVLDGVHLGHQQLVIAMVEAAHSAHNTAIAITFDPHPAVALGYAAPLLLTTVDGWAEQARRRCRVRWENFLRHVVDNLSPSSGRVCQQNHDHFSIMREPFSLLSTQMTA